MVGTTHSEEYDCSQIGSFRQFSGWNSKKMVQKPPPSQFLPCIFSRPCLQRVWHIVSLVRGQWWRALLVWIGSHNHDISILAQSRKKFTNVGGWTNPSEKYYMDVSENDGTPQIIHFNRVFHCKSSILGNHYFWKHPYSQIGNLPQFSGWKLKNIWNHDLVQHCYPPPWNLPSRYPLYSYLKPEMHLLNHHV